MRTLYLLRHAKSSWDDPSLADHDRPLAPRGKRDSKRMADEVGSVMVIAHNPGLQDLALLLAARGEEPDRLRAKYPTAALASLAIARASWSTLKPGDAELVAYVVPRDLG